MNIDKLGLKKESVVGTAIKPKFIHFETEIEFAWRNFLYEFGKSIYLFSFLNKIFFLEFKQWVIARKNPDEYRIEIY